MNAATTKKEEQKPVERLVDVADAIFERATTLDGIKLSKKQEEYTATIEETRDDAFSGCINCWRIVISLLPTSGIPQGEQLTLEIDAHKVISRCFQRLEKMGQAKTNIIKAIDKGYADGFVSLGAICLEMEDFEEAENALKSALAKNAQTMRAHAGLGELYFKMGTEALSKDPEHKEFFLKAEEEFLAAGKERFTDGFERAMDLFGTIGWRDQALNFGQKALGYYSEHRHGYGERLRGLDQKLRKLAGDDRHEKIIEGVSRALGDVFGRKRSQD